ncbi:MAG: signal peptidase I [Candidatus Peribacter sp.]|jgi:hypothetical protein|nr:signal peptidase I [Candidatus Peribacter sp.]MBT4393324.1 signal peptidase I [Candidatus Peribacter sp.]MBT4600950.1 signal peptidase I [Candidatus Peribacter sp.]MBT5148821.1 signal peptidase I [Candidatus Peribacter sp.]MBT5637905.1 signal peptidase I [Candidatus Peribacter sp.]
MSSIEKGNAANAEDFGGWFMGHFLPEDSLMSTSGLEVKWSQLKKGETRDEWAPVIDRKTVAVLIRGHLIVEFPNEEVELRSEGDYVIWKDVSHNFRTIEDSVVLTIRWPSI